MKNSVDSHRIQWLAICEHNKHELVFLDLALPTVCPQIQQFLSNINTNHLHIPSANDENMNCGRKRTGTYWIVANAGRISRGPSEVPIASPQVVVVSDLVSQRAMDSTFVHSLGK